MEQKNIFWKSVLTYGAYLAVISILISVVIWAGNIMESLGIWAGSLIGLVNLVILVVLLVIFTKAYRNKYLDGYISFKDAFVFGLLVVIFSTIISSVYTFIFNSFIDPGYTERIMLAMQTKTVEMLESKGMSQDIIDQTISKFQEKGIPTAFKQAWQGVLFGSIFGAIMALISAAIAKKKNEDSDLM